jgi:two-component system response regulator
MLRPDLNPPLRDSIDVLIASPSAADARRASQALRSAIPGISIVRVAHADQALRLMLERGLFTATPQLPGLILIDLALVDARVLLKRISTDERLRHIPVLVVSTRREVAELGESAALDAAAPVMQIENSTAFERALADAVSHRLERAADRSESSHRGTLPKRGSCSEKSRNSFGQAHASNRCSSHRAFTRRRAKDSHRHQA